MINVRIEGMPAAGQVYVDNVPVTGTWEGTEQRVWSVPVAAGTHVLRVTNPGSPSRSITLALSGPMTLRYDAIPPTTIVPRFRGLPPASTAHDGAVEVTFTVTPRLPGGVDRALELLGADGASIPLVRQDDDTRWTARVAPGRYTVRATNESDEVRRAELTLDTSRTIALDALRWRYDTRGTVLLTGLPADPVGAAFRAELTGLRAEQTDAGSGPLALPMLPLTTGERVTYPLPGRYTLRLFLEPNGEAPRLVRLGDLTAAAGESTTVPYASLESVSPSAPSPVPVTSASPPTPPPTSVLTVQGLPDGWTLRVDGQNVSLTPALTAGPHTLQVLDPTQVVRVTRALTMPAAPMTLDLTTEFGRLAAFANGRFGVVGVNARGERRGYLADVTRRAVPLAEPDRVVQEFEPIGRDAAGRMLVPFFARGHGMVLLPVTAAELRALLAQLLPMRGALRADGTYPYELTLTGPR